MNTEWIAPYIPLSDCVGGPLSRGDFQDLDSLGIYFLGPAIKAC